MTGQDIGRESQKAKSGNVAYLPWGIIVLSMPLIEVLTQTSLVWAELCYRIVLKIRVGEITRRKEGCLLFGERGRG